MQPQRTPRRRRVRRPEEETRPCPQCGESMNRHATMCRECYRKRAPKPNCSVCGSKLSIKTATLCRACWMTQHMAQTSRPTCADCGKLISWAIGHNKGPATRCRECYHRTRLEHRIVVERERPNGQMATNLDSKKVRQGRHMAGTLRPMLQDLPCAVCGYNRSKCAIHRLVAKNGYVLGNVVQVCPNCHQEIHRGVIQPPPPTVVEKWGPVVRLVL